MRQEMLHSYLQELVHGWENWPTSPQKQWQFKRVKGPSLRPYWIIELRWGDLDIPLWIHQSNNPSGSIPLGVLLQKMHLELAVLTICHQPTRGQEHNRHQRDQRPQSPWFPSLSPDHGFKSDRGSLSTTSLMSSRSDWSDGSRHSRQGRWHREEACMKINLPVFKDEDAKDAVTCQSWGWDLTVYWHADYRDHTLLPYAIRSLQGYHGELVWSSGTHITLDDMLMILDEHYNNVKALDVLSQELFQLWMADKETLLDWGIHLSRHLQVLAASFPDCFPPDYVVELKRDHFYGRLPKQLKMMVAYLKVGPQVRTYSDYLRATREAEKEDSIELPRSSRVQAADGPPNQGLLASSPWGNLRVTRHFPQSPPSAWCI